MDNSESRAITDSLGSISTGTFEGDYKFRQTIGEGGYGEVYKVVSKRDNQTYAVKKVRFDKYRYKDRIHLIKRELINNAKLSHENVVRYYDSWIEASADQSLDSTDSSDSETEYSKSHKSNTSGARSSTTKKVHVNDNKTVEVGLTRRKSTQDWKKGENADGATDVKKNEAHEKKTIEVATESCTKSSEGNICVKTGLAAFNTLNRKVKSSSSTTAEYEQADVHTGADPDATVDEYVPSDVRDIDKTADTEDDDVFDEDEIEEDNAQISVQDASTLNEILMQVSGSDHKDGTLKHVLKSDSDYNERIQEATDDSGPRYLDLYIKMEFCDETLKEAIDNRKLVQNDEKSWSYFRQIVKGLDYIHSKGITHRDLNPNNIFITHQDVVKIGDFGLSRLHMNDELDFDNTKATSNGSELEKKSKSGMTGNIGTAWYSAPEILGKPSCAYGHEIDLFSLGLIFFEMCHAPLGTGHEKIEIFQKLREKGSLPDSFDFNSKKKQGNVIQSLLHLNPGERVPLKKLMDPSEGFVVPEPVEEHHFRNMLPGVVEKPEGELYGRMIHKLFQQRNGKCWSSFPCQAVPKQVVMDHAFASVARRNGAKYIDLPLFLPIQEITKTEIIDENDPNVFLDPDGQPVLLSDSSLKTFVYELKRQRLPLCNGSACYTSQSEYITEIETSTQRHVNTPNIHYFSLSDNNDLLAIAKAVLILQQFLEKSDPYKMNDIGFDATEDFVLCLSHVDLQRCLVKLYKLGETEHKILNALFEEIGGSTRRQKLVRSLKKRKRYHFPIPVVLAAAVGIEKMRDRLKNGLKHLQKPVKGSNKTLHERVHNSLNFIEELADVLGRVGVRFEVKIEIFMTTSQVGATENGIKFRLRSKPKMQTVAKGCQFRIAQGEEGDRLRLGQDLLWYELEAYKLDKTDTDSDNIDVIILYDHKNVDEVNNTAYLYGKLTGIGFIVSHAIKTQMSLNCKILISFNDKGAVIQYDDGAKLNRIQINVKNVVKHLEQRKHVPANTWDITDNVI